MPGISMGGYLAEHGPHQHAVYSCTFASWRISAPSAPQLNSSIVEPEQDPCWRYYVFWIMRLRLSSGADVGDGRWRCAG